ncbi:MAG TPA: trypsin-like peptidase domain-containing protein [Phycisphaerae bacterium]|nr:trypsin-like peptidase domain-containing protein [Phycisphaerae bacterium]
MRLCGGMILVLSLAWPLVSALGESDTRELRRTPIVQVVEQVRDSIVNISSTELVEARRMDLLDMFIMPPAQRQVTSVGSGFVMHEAGYIVTNAHVVSRSVDLRVTFANGEEYKATAVVISDRYDLAILRIEPEHPLKPIPMGSSEDLMIGETTIAIGNPLGYANTVTSGIVSALHREIEHSSGTIYDDLIQTDASINPGSSGGPLLNIAGELIGITTAIRADAQNIGFAIPVGRLHGLLPDMLDYAITERRNFDLGMRVEGLKDPRIVTVEAGGPADRAGVRVGDSIVRVNDAPIQRDVDFYISMLGRSVGDRVTMQLRRGNETEEIGFTLPEIPKPDGAALAQAHFGLQMEDLNPETAARFGRRHVSGVLVVGVEPQSPADRGGLRPGDLLVQLGRHRIANLEQLGQLLEEVKPNDPAYVLWWRVDRRGGIEAWETRLQAR